MTVVHFQIQIQRDLERDRIRRGHLHHAVHQYRLRHQSIRQKQQHHRHQLPLVRADIVISVIVDHRIESVAAGNGNNEPCRIHDNGVEVVRRDINTRRHHENNDDEHIRSSFKIYQSDTRTRSFVIR